MTHEAITGLLFLLKNIPVRLRCVWSSVISDGLLFWAISQGDNEVMVFSLKLLSCVSQHAESVRVFLISAFDKMSILIKFLVQHGVCSVGSGNRNPA